MHLNENSMPNRGTVSQKQVFMIIMLLVMDFKEAAAFRCTSINFSMVGFAKMKIKPQETTSGSSNLCTDQTAFKFLFHLYFF